LKLNLVATKTLLYNW